MPRLNGVIAGALAAMLLPAGGGAEAAPHGALATRPAMNIPPDALREAASERVRGFYETNGWRPVWDAESSAALDRALADRARHGLDLVPFQAGPDSSADQARAEIARTEAALRFADALAHGLVDPADLHEVYTLPRVRTELETALASALARGRLGEWLAGLAPQDDDYARLSRAYLDLRTQRGEGADIGAGVLRVGESDVRVAAIVAQLVEAEYLPARQGEPEASGEAVPTLFTQAIADAVEALQRDYGIAADGVVGPDTLAVLNLGPGDRARAVAVALERRRWLSRSAPATRIDVNTAASRLSYFRDGVLADTRRVVVGKPGTETPWLQSPIYRLVANPTWTVPKSIQNGELAHAGAAYRRRNNMELRNGWIVQRPGPGNALGLVKFDMHNDHAIFLHDTSAPALFARSQRHRSHGCVRVEDAQGFARLLARDQQISDRWQDAQGGSEPQFVDLPTSIPVRLLYRNVFINREGGVSFRMDPYGWNPPIARALGFPDRHEARMRDEAIDIGP